MSQIRQSTSGVPFYRRQALVANKIFACGDCGAPGRYMSRPDVKENWPECFVEPGDSREGRLLGEPCPHCGAPGRYANSAEMLEEWPKLFVPHNDELEGQHVGTICPNCRESRPGDICPHCKNLRPMDEPHGEIWSKEYTL